MTRDEFKAVTGVEPSSSMLEVANCPQYRPASLHGSCGICEHGIPRTFNCTSCGRWGVRDIVRISSNEVEDDSKIIKGYDGVRA
jgi:hypothetical protein